MCPHATELEHADRLGAEMIGAGVETERHRQVLPYAFQSHAREEIVVDDFLVRASNKEQSEGGQDPSTVFAGCDRDDEQILQ